MTYEKALKHYQENVCRLCRAKHCENCPIATAKTAMEKQIPKRPKRSKREIRYCEVWECPRCGFEWSTRIVVFCYKCGQAIDWSVEQ